MERRDAELYFGQAGGGAVGMQDVPVDTLGVLAGPILGRGPGRGQVCPPGVSVGDPREQLLRIKWNTTCGKRMRNTGEGLALQVVLNHKLL